MTPYGVGRCHEVTEGTGDRWEQRPPDKPVNQAQRGFTDHYSITSLGLPDKKYLTAKVIYTP